MRAKKYKFTSEQIKDIIFLYTEEKLTSTKIGKIYNCSFGPIERILRENGISIKRKNKNKYNNGDIVGNNFLLIEKGKLSENGKSCISKFKCPRCGKIFSADLYNITCKNSNYISCGCYKKEYINFKPDISLIGQKFGHLLVLEDDGTRVNTPGEKDRGSVKWKCICDCGEITHVTGEHLKTNHTTSCGKCCISKGEDAIKQILLTLKLSFIQQKKFSDCKDKRCLPFDFYLSEYNCCIEYDGEQHFHVPNNKTSTLFTEERINLIQEHDNIKTEYCKNNNIKLIRIPYTDYNKINTNYIIDKLKELNN